MNDNPHVSTSPEQPPTLMQQLGGISGLISSTLPIVVLVPVNTVWGLAPALGAALVIAAAVLVWRLVRKETLQPAISGFFGVALCAVIAWIVGDAKGYFLYGIWMSLLLAVVAVASVIAGYPGVGVIWKGLNGEGMAWRAVPSAKRMYSVATLAWAVVFIARFGVQRWFYDGDATTALAVSRIAMGWPLTAVVVMVTIFAVRRADRAMESHEQG